ncbi:high affinity immunoglobulin alpha and immunoglobulin mu Fc receptor [Perognathus longimembris pacificus]|uniref:high affinity immunoglobulin alpha and immunoglobulin mu Fc receptor n=1 Tax=Perognathus longimembris pacificus TaxID=214514 RepID=UPI002019EE7A|nr:high affinity immunoglobulin alpha and immunoglobulin mu Fc receptor [Perognathus longimembris pacificus]
MPLVLILCVLQGSSSAPPHKDLHLRWWRAGSLPSRTRLWAVDTFPSSSPFCWPDKQSSAAADVLKGPRLVSGEAGGAVIIQCHYTPLSVNRHQRKYWCRLRPPTYICYTVVSTNHYTHHDYLGRVSLVDFPHSGLFVVRLSQLSLDDVGYYRCGIGDGNNLLFLAMNLIVSAGPSNMIPITLPASGKLTTASSGTASPGANPWTPEATQTPEEEGSEWDRVAPSAETTQTTASTKGRQRPGTDREVAPEMDSQARAPIKITVPTVQSPALNLRSLSSTPKDAWTWSTGSSVTNGIRIFQGEPQMTTTQASWPGEGTQRLRMALVTAKKTTGTIRPLPLVSEQAAWEILRETLVVSQQQALGSTKGSTPAPGAWTLDTPHLEAASGKGSTDQDSESTVADSDLQGDSGSQATLSQALATDSLRPTGKGASMQSAFPEEERSSWILIPGSTMLALLLLVALVLSQRKVWRKRTSQEAERAPRVTLIQMTRLLEVNPKPKQLLRMQGKALHSNFPPTQASLTIQEQDPGP